MQTSWGKKIIQEVTTPVDLPPYAIHIFMIGQYYQSDKASLKLYIFWVPSTDGLFTEQLLQGVELCTVFVPMKSVTDIA